MAMRGDIVPTPSIEVRRYGERWTGTLRAALRGRDRRRLNARYVAIARPSAAQLSPDRPARASTSLVTTRAMMATHCTRSSGHRVDEVGCCR